MRRDGGNSFARGKGRRGRGEGGEEGTIRKMRRVTRGDYYGDPLQVYDSSVSKIRARASILTVY